MTAELKQKITSEFLKGGIAVIVMAVVIYFQRLDYMNENYKTRTELIKTNDKFNSFILNEYRVGITTIEKNTDVMYRVNLRLLQNDRD